MMMAALEGPTTDQRGRSGPESVVKTCSENKPQSSTSRRPRRPKMVIAIIVLFVLTAVLANALAWPLLFLLYVTQLRSRVSGQRTQLARDLGISALALKDRKVVGFFHPFW